MVKRLGIWYNRDILIEMVKTMQNKFKSKLDVYATYRAFSAFIKY